MTIKSTNNDTPEFYHIFDKAILNSLESGCDTYIIYDSNIPEFLCSYNFNVQISKQKVDHRKFIFILNSTDVDTNLINNLLTSDDLKYIPDFIIIYPDELSTVNNSNLFYESTIDEITFKIITREMDEPDLVLLDYWYSNNESFLYNNNLFPSKVKNLYKTPLNINVIPEFLPYIMMEKDVIVYPNREPETVVDGFEVLLMREYAKRYNITLNFTIEWDFWGRIYPNRTGFGLVGNMLEDNFDAGIGSVLISEYYSRYLEFSSSIAWDRITCIVPSPRFVDKFNVVLIPFTISLWIAVIVAIIILTITFNFISHETTIILHNDNQTNTVLQRIFKGFSKSFFIIYRVNVLQSIPLDSVDQSNFILRILLALIFLLALLISTAYCGGLATILTLPQYEKPIRTRQDLIDSKMKWGGNDIGLVEGFIRGNNSQNIELIKTFTVYSNDELKNLLPRSFAYLVDVVNNEVISIPDYVPEQIVLESQLMHEELHSGEVHSLFRKGSPFLQEFNHFVFKYRESGVLLKMQKDVGNKYFKFSTTLHLQTKGHKNTQPNTDPVAMSIYDLQSVFLLWCLGIVVSCISFVFEKYQKLTINMLTKKSSSN